MKLGLHIYDYTWPEGADQLGPTLVKIAQAADCIGYLGHPFKKQAPLRRRKKSFPSLQTQEGWCTIQSRQPHPHARTTLFSCDGAVFVMAGVLTSLRRLKDGCWHALSSHFARWTKPLTSSLPLQTMAELNRSRSELVAENALLRQQLIMLRRQVKRPSISRTDRILLVLLARLVRTWQQALLIVQPDTSLAVASGALSLLLETPIKDSYSQAEGRSGNHRLNQADGNGESTVGC